MRSHVGNHKKYSYNHVHDATSMAYILKELAGADERQAMKLAPAPNINKANAVGKYRSILQNANDSWDKAQASGAELSSCDGLDSSQEECLRVSDKHHRDKKGAAREAVI